MCVPFSLLVGRWYICAEIQKTENYESRESTRMDPLSARRRIRFLVPHFSPFCSR